MTGSAASRLETAIDRISAQNERLAIVTSLDAESARQAAAASDARAANGDSLGSLDGLLLGVKDNIAVAGLPWTAGLGARRATIAATDAECVANLRAAGAIPFAMLNMHEGALGATTDNPHFGRCLNPLDEVRTPGGSSGGSGAAIAAGFCDISLGTDTMGSVRIPAAYCGVFGLKPTRKLVSTSGLVFLSPTLDTIGPLARDVPTLAAMVDIMSGRADRGSDLPDTAKEGWNPEPPGTATLGVPRQIDTVDCEPEVLAGLEQAISAGRTLGYQIVEVDMPDWSPNRARIAGLLVSEAEGAVEMATILDQPGDQLMSAELRRLLTYGKSLTAEKLEDAYARVGAAAKAAERALEQVDLLLLPTAPQLPFIHGDPIPANQADLTSLANFLGGPSLAIPVPRSPLPASVQLVGAPHSERPMLAIGHAMAQALNS